MRRISCVELRKQQAFYLLEPFGEPWRQTAALRSDIKNTFGGKQGGGQFKWQELMPVPHRQTAEEMEQILMMAMGGLPNGPKANL